VPYGPWCGELVAPRPGRDVGPTRRRSSGAARGDPRARAAARPHQPRELRPRARAFRGVARPGDLLAKSPSGSSRRRRSAENWPNHARPRPTPHGWSHQPQRPWRCLLCEWSTRVEHHLSAYGASAETGQRLAAWPPSRHRLRHVRATARRPIGGDRQAVEAARDVEARGRGRGSGARRRRAGWRPSLSAACLAARGVGELWMRVAAMHLSAPTSRSSDRAPSSGRRPTARRVGPRLRARSRGVSRTSARPQGRSSLRG
jgi:hypothetical protein